MTAGRLHYFPQGDYITLQQDDYIILQQGDYITAVRLHYITAGWLYYFTARRLHYITAGRLHYIRTGRLPYPKRITLLYDRAITLHYDRAITLPTGRLHYGTRMHFTYAALHEVTRSMDVWFTQNEPRRQQFHVAGRPTSVCQRCKYTTSDTQKRTIKRHSRS